MNMYIYAQHVKEVDDDIDNMTLICSKQKSKAHFAYCNY